MPKFVSGELLENLLQIYLFHNDSFSCTWVKSCFLFLKHHISDLNQNSYPVQLLFHKHNTISAQKLMRLIKNSEKD